MNNHLVYEKRIVAFVDILGFKTLIDDSKTDTTIRKTIKSVVNTIYNVKEQKAGRNNEGVFVSTFSDSAVISYPANKRDSLFHLLMDVILLQLSLGRWGIMIRGGIAIGDVYHDDKTIFGPAMNDAYYLESTVAQFPRVVIMRNTLDLGIELTVDNREYSYKYDHNDIMDCVKKDDYNDDKSDSNPNLYFVDFLRQDQELNYYGDEYYEWLKEFRQSIITGLNRYSEASDEYAEMSDEDKKIASRVFKKYRWMLNYWNSVVTDDRAAFPVPNIDIKHQIEFRNNYRKLEIKKRYPYS